MRFPSIFRRSLWLALPAVLAFSGCSDDSEPAPDQARVLAVHAAINNSTRSIKVTVGDVVGPSIAYGANSPYQTVATGNLTVSAAIDAAGGTTIYSASQAIAKDKSYSFFAYNVAGQSAGTVSGLFVEDNLTAPATAGNAKVRLVHVGLGLDSPLTLSRTPDGGGALVAVTAAAAAGSASAFVDIPAGVGSYNLSNSSNSAIQPAAGGSVLATQFAAGGIYSIIVRGTTTANAPTTAERFTLQLLKHN